MMTLMNVSPSTLKSAIARSTRIMREMNKIERKIQRRHEALKAGRVEHALRLSCDILTDVQVLEGLNEEEQRFEVLRRDSEWERLASQPRKARPSKSRE